MNTHQINAMLDITALITRHYPHSKPFVVRRVVSDLARHARSLHNRYEAACSYEWANTDKYQARTDYIEGLVMGIAEDNGLTIGFQRDPRGWPLVIKIDGQDYYLS